VAVTALLHFIPEEGSDWEFKAAALAVGEERTCEWCGAQMIEGDLDGWLTTRWRCRVIKKSTGYTLKHWAYWRVCKSCECSVVTGTGTYGFDKFVFPIIANIDTRDPMEQLVAVQPMQQPPAGFFHLDFVVGPEGARV